jgi:uncharacterized membrane protein
MRKYYKPAALFCAGGLVYVAVELLWRGRSHPSMLAVGGLCFLLIGLINEGLSWNLGLLWQALIGAVIVLFVEFCAGCVVNLWWGWGVWDYAGVPGNLLGQVCPPFAAAWAGLAAVGIVLDDWLRWRVFGEEKPRYTVF